MADIFEKESDFEEAVIKLMAPHKGWDTNILRYPTEEELIQNWANIIFKNNRARSELGDWPLTKSEMAQIIKQIKELNTPNNINAFITHGLVSIKRDNTEDINNYDQTVTLRIYDPDQIAGGISSYQIAQQPQFNKPKSVFPKRRGDLMLLINGMPLIHIELKRTGVHINEAVNQIQIYYHEGIFEGFFSLIQVFVAMNPDDGVYFANPGSDKNLNPLFQFHWADSQNRKYTDWKDIVGHLLNIPMAHQLIGYYSVADKTDGTLKVMRSYQYYAANAIRDSVVKIAREWDKPNWSDIDQLGGYVWHTTGAGKTMTSYKSAQLIAASNKADKVVFLLDRIELGDQTYTDYVGFSKSQSEVTDTSYTWELVKKLESSAVSDRLIVTSIQKMSRIKVDEGGKYAAAVDKIKEKHIVFICDECHRSQFGDMHRDIKKTFPRAVFFGFTGTPIFDENKKKLSETSTIFGNELHRYTITDGINDKNVLGFDPYRVCSFKDSDIKHVVALEKAKAKDMDEVNADPVKQQAYYDVFNSTTMKMVTYTDDDGNVIKGFEDYLPKSQYRTEQHRKAVVEDIKNNWKRLNRGGLFHAIFATSSILESIKYYRLIKQEIPEMKVTVLFDKNLDLSNDSVLDKEEGLEEILKDYNKRYGMDFKIDTHADFKRDVSARLAHKDAYLMIQPEEKLDLLIVVNQMLTGFDSKWINTIYIDKEMEYENIIQAFSRTNRNYKEDKKPFGTIRYYRKPYTMEKRIEAAFKLYSGDRPTGIFVDKLSENIQQMNNVYHDLCDLFPKQSMEIPEGKTENPDFSNVPETKEEKAKFVKTFNKFNKYLEAALIQGFDWDKTSYEFEVTDASGNTTGTVVEMVMPYSEYQALLQRYKELRPGKGPNPHGGDNPDVPYDLKGYLIETDTGKIDADYMNSNFTKFIKARAQNESDEVVEAAKNLLHKSMQTLTKEEQLYANVFLGDIERGELVVEEGKTFRDYITQYQSDAKKKQRNDLVAAFGVDEKKLAKIMEANINENNIDEFGRFTDLMDSVDFEKAKAYFEKRSGETLSIPEVNMDIDTLLRKFVLSGGINI